MTRPLSSRAWYLGCTPDDIAPRGVLVGDRGRVLIAADMLEDATILNEDRGLTTTTGTWKGVPITVSAFGMGAAIAAVVLHELASVGMRSVVRLGTALTLGSSQLGDLIVADSALRGEATSATYVPQGFPAVPDLELTNLLKASSTATERRVVVGMIGSYDGFYSELFADPGMPSSGTVDFDELVQLGVVGLDMETSAVLAIGRAIGVRAGTICLASVDGADHSKLEGEDRTRAEQDLLVAGFDALATLNILDKENLI